MSKVEVNGQNADPLYEWMKAQKTNLFMATIKWNFEKFLIDKKGTVRDRYASTTTPESLKSTIDKLLAE
jgi:glutathione peroxidase-family protein